MSSTIRRCFVLALVLFSCAGVAAVNTASQSPAGRVVHDVRAFGAKGDGKTLDTDAINKAIETAAGAGGGTVHFPAGTYLTFSIRLKSNIALYLDQGSIILAADPAEHKGAYDMPEPNEWDLYQDFGHSHWQNSLIWGIGLENVSILGPGLIHGKGLTKRGPGARKASAPVTLSGTPSPVGEGESPEAMRGLGNKAIALKLSRNVTLRDFTMFMGGHFALLATGVDNLTIDNVKVDTNRDGFDIDACRNVRISNVSVNSPNDDAIVLKSSYGLGFARATENVTITNCQVTGYDLGTFLDGTFKRTQELAPDRDRVTGRIKFGTESNGGFKNITISNCVFDRSRGLAIETVDGGLIEDITVTNITMRDVTTAPLFLRIGNRARGPNNPPPGAIRRVEISNVTAYDADPRYASIIAGLPGRPIEDVRLSNIRIVYKGGGTRAEAEASPEERESSYPEPSMFGPIPAYGFYVRHARGLVMRDVEVSFMKDEQRPAFFLDDVTDVVFDGARAKRTAGVPLFVLRNVTDFTVRNTAGVPDTRKERAERETL